MSWFAECRHGARMLLKYPGLTLVGGLAMAFAIGVGATAFEVVSRATHPDLPFADGERIVAIELVDRSDGTERAASSYDFVAWREQLTTVEDLGAFRLLKLNLAVEGRAGEPVTTAEISATAFRMTGVVPLLGRTLVDADENAAAPPVVVLGHRLWQSRFNADTAVLGRVVRLGVSEATVVGVMPEGFSFPVDDDLWIPFRSTTLERAPMNDALRVFGRLAADATIEEAQAQAATLAERSAANFPDAYARLTPQVLPYAAALLPISSDVLVRAGLYSLNAFAALFLILVCGNVAMLMFARAATRERELLVRSALGASRRRIVAHLFLEAFVLAACAAAAGLAAASLVVRWIGGLMRAGPERWPFWLDGGLSASTVGYAILLAVLAAAVAGALPGLKVTRRDMWARLHQSTAGAGGLRMGGIWTVTVIAQIAATVLFTAVAYAVQRQAAYIASVEVGFPIEQVLSVRLDREPQTAEGTAEARERFLSSYMADVRELERRLAETAVVAKSTVAERLPLMAQNARYIDLEGGETSNRIAVSSTAVDLDFFGTFDMPTLAGRVFAPADAGVGAGAIVVNDTFVEQVLGGNNPLGRRIRYNDDRFETEPGPWLEIVGVVRDLAPHAAAPMNLDNPSKARVYEPLGAGFGGGGYPLYLGLRARTDVASLAVTVREIAAVATPELLLSEVLPLEQATNEDARFWRSLANGILSGSAITLFLSLAGIYAAMSFTVSQRTREIGLRVAIGAQSHRVVAEVFRRPVRHVVAGVLLGSTLLIALLSAGRGIGSVIVNQGPLLLAQAVLVMSVCLLACAGPIRRALRVHPIDALRADG